MSLPHRTSHRFAAAVATACAGLAIANTAGALDLRDWGRKFPSDERFVVLPQFNNEAVLDKETQLVWQAVAGSNPQTATWLEARLRCYKATTGGRRGWRLPTYPEIASVFGTDGVKPAAFSGVLTAYYWASTDYPANTVVSYAMLFLAPTGSTAGAPNTHTSTDKYAYWCVRGPAAA